MLHLHVLRNDMYININIFENIWIKVQSFTQIMGKHTCTFSQTTYMAGRLSKVLSIYSGNIYLSHWIPLHDVDCAHLCTSPLSKFNPDQYYWYRYSGPLYFWPIILVVVLYGLSAYHYVLVIMSPKVIMEQVNTSDEFSHYDK